MKQADNSAVISPELPPLVKRSLNRLVRAFAPERVILFGSRAKGTAQTSSDVDLLVVAEVDGHPSHHQRRARQLTSDCFPPIDVVIATPAEVADAGSARSPFLLSILGSGISVYTRPSAILDPVSQG